MKMNLYRFEDDIGSFERGSPERFNTNEHEPNPHKKLTPLSTTNLKTMGLWVLILIWCSTFSLMWDLDSHLDSQQMNMYVFLSEFRE